MRKPHQGFTLIELMIVITIAGIVLTLGIPSFNELLRNNRLAVQSNDLVTALNLGRAEAVKRAGRVTVCASNNQTSCTSSAWQHGWLIRHDASGEVVQVFPPMKGATTVTSPVSQVRYTQAGFLDGGSPVSMTLCAGTGKSGRRINITSTGRPANVTPHPIC